MRTLQITCAATALLFMACSTAIYAQHLTSAATSSSSSVVTPKKDWTLPDGRIMKSAYILDRKPNGVTFANDSAVAFVRFTDMPPEMQKALGYDAVKSASYEKQLEKSRKASEKEAAKRKEAENEAMRKANARLKESAIFRQKQRIQEIELQIQELQRKATVMDKHLEEDRGAKFSLAGSGNCRIISPFGFGLRRAGNGQAARVINDASREINNIEIRRGNVSQDIISLQLKLNAEKRILERMLQ